MRSRITDCLIIGRGEVLFGSDENGAFVNLDDYVVIPREEYAAIMRDDELPPCPWQPPAWQQESKP